MSATTLTYREAVDEGGPDDHSDRIDDPFLRRFSQHDQATGDMKAAADPCIARAAISVSKAWLIPHTTDASEKLHHSSIIFSAPVESTNDNHLIAVEYIHIIINAG